MGKLDELMEMGVDETTSLEHAVLILYLNEETNGKPLANEAAAELARLEAIEAAAREVSVKFRGYSQSMDRRIALEALEAALQPAGKDGEG
jgi:hypothetical protein